ncbi:DnaJ domain-containing protein [Allochromatium palmeri]|uniref:DnaJ domain-containing protein n=1 Tax=Allochromatium palmeri TaxID=231048 RepID=A0A6N8EF91_9GAMM|nr:DnaJ domain-containing protein [Allochromatium palmeri]MTW22190.1 DnaJ domain-containing protein [Allochromatium palmeri]
MSLSWTHQIAKSLASGRPSLALELHLDALLVWLSNPDNPRAAELEQAIGRQRLARTEASATAYRLLDQWLFASDDPPAPETLGLDPSTSATLAKQRYRRLVQVYHPDRHPERTDWATHRTEQINRAFAAFQRGERGTTRVGAHKTSRHSASGSTARRAWRLPPVWLPEALRDVVAPAWVWTHARLTALTPLQQRLLSIAAIAGVLIFTLALWPEEPPKRAPRIIHHPLGIAPRPVLVDAPAPEIEDPRPMPESLRPLIAQASAPDADASQPDLRPVPSEREDSPREVALVDVPPSDPLDEASTVVPEPETFDREPPDQAPRAILVEPTSAKPEPASAPLDAEDRPSAAPATAPTRQAPPPVKSDPTASSAPRTRIPAATLPDRPTPPTPPAAPLALGAAPAVATAKPTAIASAPIEVRCQAAPEILSRFQNAYQNGALDQLMALYSPLAKENDLATWFAIRQTYAEWFRTTSARRITFEQTQVQPIADSQRCALMAVFQVNYLDQQSRLVTQAGIIELLLEYKGTDWLILRARY